MAWAHGQEINVESWSLVGRKALVALVALVARVLPFSGPNEKIDILRYSDILPGASNPHFFFAGGQSRLRFWRIIKTHRVR